MERSSSREAALELGPRGVKLSRENAKRGIISNEDSSSMASLGTPSSSQQHMNGNIRVSSPMPFPTSSVSTSTPSSGDVSHAKQGVIADGNQGEDGTSMMSSLGEQQQQMYIDDSNQDPVNLKSNEHGSQLSDFSELFSPTSEFTFTLAGGMRLQSRDRQGLHSSESQMGSTAGDKGEINRSGSSPERAVDINQPWRHTTRFIVENSLSLHINTLFHTYEYIFNVLCFLFFTLYHLKCTHESWGSRPSFA